MDEGSSESEVWSVRRDEADCWLFRIHLAARRGGDLGTLSGSRIALAPSRLLIETTRAHATTLDARHRSQDTIPHPWLCLVHTLALAACSMQHRALTLFPLLFWAPSLSHPPAWPGSKQSAVHKPQPIVSHKTSVHCPLGTRPAYHGAWRAAPRLARLLPPPGNRGGHGQTIQSSHAPAAW